VNLPVGAASSAEPFLELGLLALGLAALARLGGTVGLSPIPLYLLGGVLAGALELGLDEPVIEVGAQIGIVLLLFMLGLEYSAEELTGSLRASLPAGVLDGALNFSVGFVCGLVLGWSATAAFLLGGVTYISSSGVIAKILSDLDRLGNRETPSVLSILVIEDLAMAVFLPVASVLLVGGVFFDAVRSISLAVLAAATILFVALRYGRHVSRLVASPSNEVLLLSLLGLVLVVAGAAEEIQVSAGVGAFLVGIAVSGPLVGRAKLQLAPLRDLFAAMFFVFFGLGIDTGELPAVALPVVALAVASGATKVATGWWAARRVGAERHGSARAGTVLIARGEFSIVIAGLGVSAGVESQLGPLVAGYVLLTAIAAAVLTRVAEWREPARPPSALAPTATPEPGG
jgi:CPA2 family monovalent cation:H+ antiporter-2